MLNGTHDGTHDETFNTFNAFSETFDAGATGFGAIRAIGGDCRDLGDAVDRAAGHAGHATGHAADRFVEEQLFEEDVRAVLSVMRPNRRERLLGWSEYRTGGAHFRATISWDSEFAKAPASAPADPHLAHLDAQLSVPRLTDVLESILVGSVKNQDELHAADEFEIYRGVVRELYRRLDEMQSCYE